MSALQRFIDIFVNNSEAVNKLGQTEQQLNKVDKATTQVTQSTDMLSKKTQQNSKSIRENGGLMGILGAATRGASNDFKDAIEAAEGFGISLKGVRGAIIATGIGALAVFILELVTNWEKWKGVIDGSTSSLENLKRTIDGIDQSLERLNNNFSKEEASLQNIIDLMKAEGATQDELIEKEKKLNALQTINAKTNQEALIAKRDEYRRVLDNELPEFLKIYDEIGLVERNLKAGFLPDETIWGRQINSLDETREYLAKLNISLAEYAKGEDKINKTAKEYLDINKQIISGRIKINNLENDPKVLQAQKDRAEGLKLINEEIKKQVKLISDLGVNANTSLNKLLSITEQFKQLNDELDNHNETYKAFMNISKLWYDSKDAVDNYKNALIKLNEQERIAISKINEDKTLNSDEKKEQIKNITEVAETQRKTIAKTLAQFKLSNASLDEINEKTQKLGKEALAKQLEKTNSENAATDLKINKLNRVLITQLELINQENKLLDFEKGFEKDGKWLDNRNDNSTKYVEIAKQINKIYELRKRLVEQTLGLDAQEARNEYQKKQALQDKLKMQKQAADIALQAEKDRVIAAGGDIETDAGVRAAQRRQNEAEAAYIEAVGKTADAKLEYDQKYADSAVALSELKAKKEIDLENNTLNEKQAKRQEDLERQQMYADKSIAIAEEAANMLNAIAAISGRKGKDFAEAALKIQKVAGVARVVIATQEEIRGIWSNAALSALPPAIGNARKALLTAAAAARAGISVATILSQKIGGSPSSTSVNAGGSGPEANFNVVAASGTNQLAATIASQQNQPVRAYVVSSDISTEQALSRNRIQTATFL